MQSKDFLALENPCFGKNAYEFAYLKAISEHLGYIDWCTIFGDNLYELVKVIQETFTRFISLKKVYISNKSVWYKSPLGNLKNIMYKKII